MKKIISLVATTAMLVPFAAQACDAEKSKKGDDSPRVAAGQTFRVQTGWRWKQEKSSKGCEWQVLVDAGSKFIVRGSGGKTYKWIAISKITDPKYKNAKQYLKSNSACGYWVGQNQN